MGKFYKYILFFLFIFLSLSCQEGREAGDLLGQWRMRGSDVKYVSFSGSVVLFRYIHKGEVFGKFQHQGDSLFIQCSSINSLAKDTCIVEDSFELKPFTDIRLKIENLDDDNLILSKGTKTWSLYKY